LNVFSPEGRANFCSSDAQEAYRLVYNIEMYLRHMVRWELVAKAGRDWKTLLGNAGNAADARRRNERELRLIDADERNLLSYLLLTELKDVMTSEAVWPIFKNRWPPQDLFLADFKIFNAIRAKVAHFRPLTTLDMRAIDRFRSIVEQMTAHYRGQQRAEKQLDPDAPGIPEPIVEPIKDWIRECASGTGRWASLAVSAVHAYVVIVARLRIGSFAPSAVSALIDGTRCDALFLSIDEPAIALKAYLPRCLKEREAVAMMAGLRGFGLVEDELFPDEGEPEHFDFSVPFDLPLPMQFRA